MDNFSLYVHITSESFWNLLFHLCCTGIFWLNSSFAPFRRTDCERLHEKLFYLLSQKVLLTQWHTLFGFLSSFYVALWFFFGVVSSYFSFCLLLHFLLHFAPSAWDRSSFVQFEKYDCPLFRTLWVSCKSNWCSCT